MNCPSLSKRDSNTLPLSIARLFSATLKMQSIRQCNNVDGIEVKTRIKVHNLNT